jgi:predicted GIY-YIG superfamily endonuclease
MMNASMNWSVYIIRCTENMLYTGITPMSSDDSTNMLPVV